MHLLALCIWKAAPVLTLPAPAPLHSDAVSDSPASWPLPNLANINTCLSPAPAAGCKVERASHQPTSAPQWSSQSWCLQLRCQALCLVAQVAQGSCCPCPSCPCTARMGTWLCVCSCGRRKAWTWQASSGETSALQGIVHCAGKQRARCQRGINSSPPPARENLRVAQAATTGDVAGGDRGQGPGRRERAVFVQQPCGTQAGNRAGKSALAPSRPFPGRWPSVGSGPRPTEGQACTWHMGPARALAWHSSAGNAGEELPPGAAASFRSDGCSAAGQSAA